MSKLGIVSLTGLLCLTLATGAWAQRGMGRGAGWGPGDSYGRMYNPTTVETVSGEVARVDKFTPGQGISYGVHLTLKTDQETIPVHLGPGWYVEQQGITLAAGDKVEVTGSRVTYQGKPAIIAAQVKKDGKILMLRDANGVPAWAGQRRR